MKPITRKEKILDAILSGNTDSMPTPITREETYLEAIAKKGASIGGAMQYQGTTAFEGLPENLTSAMVGYVYNISNDFTTNARFVEGAGKTYSAGTDIAVINAGTVENPAYKFNVAANFVDFTPIENRIQTLSNDISDAFDDTTAYAIGDVVIYQDRLYKFTSAHSAGAWNVSEVEAITVDDIYNAGANVEISHNEISANDTRYTYDSVTEGLRETASVNAPVDITLIDSVPTAGSTNLVTSGGVYTALQTKVDKETGKSLSTNDFTNTYKNQLDGLGTSSTKDYTDTFDEDGTEVTTGKAVADAINTEGVIDTPSQIMSFADGSDSPMKSCTVSIEPVQDLHGYDYPWVGGAGKNKLPMTVDGIKALNNDSGSWSGNTYTMDGVSFEVMTDDGNCVTGIKVNRVSQGSTVAILQLSNYTANTGDILNGCPSGGNSRYKIYTRGGSTHNNGIDTVVDSSDIGVERMYAIAVFSDSSPSNLIFRPMIRIATETDPTFEPYSNICSITGQTEVVIEDVGKNLCPINNINGTLYQNIRCYLPQGTYTISAEATSTDTDANICIATLLDKNEATMQQLNFSRGRRDYNVFTTTKDVYSINFYASNSYVHSINDTFAFNDIQIELGNTATEYEPYNGATYTIQLGQEVYGGRLDVTKGKLVVTKIYKKFSDLTWKTQGGNYGRFIAIVTDAYYGAADVSVISNAYKSYTDTNKTPLVNGIYMGTYAGDININVYDENYPNESDLEAWKTATANYEVVYELATPLTYQLTPTQVKSLLGSNNIWADTGEMEKIIYTKGTTTLSLTIADLYNIISSLDARVKKLEG